VNYRSSSTLLAVVPQHVSGLLIMQDGDQRGMKKPAQLMISSTVTLRWSPGRCIVDAKRGPMASMIRTQRGMVDRWMWCALLRPDRNCDQHNQTSMLAAARFAFTLEAVQAD
jgi:hypothetical protein